MKAIKKPDMQLYISGLINQLLKQVMPLYESTLLLSYSPNNDLFWITLQLLTSPSYVAGQRLYHVIQQRDKITTELVRYK